MHDAIEKLRRKMHPVTGGRCLLGLSGGADSVALLMMLMPLVKENRIHLEAAHVNHGIRGQESDEDERFCTCLCESEGIPLHIFHAELKGKTDEAAAREARFRFFRKLYAEMKADALILAHQADDQAETFLMHLLRGAGPDGLACMKAEDTVDGIHILRPMLFLRREEIRNALQEDGITWREDSSNKDLRFLRNRIREEVFPVLRNISGTAAEKICHAVSLIQADNEILNAQAREILPDVIKGCRLDAETLSKNESALRSRVLRMWWGMQGPVLEEHTLSHEQTEALDGLLFEEKGKVNLPGGLVAVRNGRYVFLRGDTTDPPEPVTVKGPETVFGEFRLEETASQGNPGDGKRNQEVPEGFTRGCTIRNRRPGDRIRPFGSSGSRKLQDYLTDRKIAEPYRDHIPLLCKGTEVLLVCGVGAGNIPYWDGKNSPIRLTWYGDMPWME